MNPFVGRWRITHMEVWDSAALDLVVSAFVKFEADGQGEFQFIAVRSWLDCRVSERDGFPCIEFSWEGVDDRDPRCGRGWAVLSGDRLEGRWYFHQSTQPHSASPPPLAPI